MNKEPNVKLVVCSKPGSSERETACWMQLTVGWGKTVHTSRDYNLVNHQRWHHKLASDICIFFKETLLVIKHA